MYIFISPGRITNDRKLWYITRHSVESTSYFLSSYRVNLAMLQFIFLELLLHYSFTHLV